MYRLKKCIWGTGKLFVYVFVDSNRDKSKGPGGMGIPQGMPPGTAGMSQTMQDPIGALQNLTVQGIGPVGQQGRYCPKGSEPQINVNVQLCGENSTWLFLSSLKHGDVKCKKLINIII